jgi:multidrug efflux pump subunit AcrA (membrane-fusion protein)
MKRFYVTIGLLLIAMEIHCSGRKQQESENFPKATVSVKIAPVTRGTIGIVVLALGKTNAERQEKIISPITGRIVEQNGLPGSPVRKGEVLAVVRTKESDAAISGARTLLLQAATPRQQEEAQASIDLALKTQNSLNLSASLDGIIISRSTDNGQIIPENTELFTIVDPTSIDFWADVPLLEVPKLRPGQKGAVRFDADPANTYPVILATIGVEADTQSQNVKARLRFVEPVSRIAAIKLNMPGTAMITVGVHTGVLLVPRTALLRNDENDRYSVVTITKDSLAKTVRVEAGMSNDSSVEITGNALSEGMPVITQGNYGLADSTRITTAFPE